MKGLVIEPAKQPYVMDVVGYDEMTAIVGGYLQLVPFGPTAVAYVDEDAKVRGDKAPVPNLVATTLCHVIRSIDSRDYIAGTMLVVGTAPDDGEDNDVPEDVVRIVMKFWDGMVEMQARRRVK